MHLLSSASLFHYMKIRSDYIACIFGKVVQIELNKWSIVNSVQFLVYIEAVSHRDYKAIRQLLD